MLDGHVKDVTNKYTSNWLYCSRKLRFDEAWWRESLASYVNPDSERDASEDLQVQGTSFALGNKLDFVQPTLIALNWTYLYWMYFLCTDAFCDSVADEEAITNKHLWLQESSFVSA